MRAEDAIWKWGYEELDSAFGFCAGVKNLTIDIKNTLGKEDEV
ncbi:MAG: hypothetical protein QXK34_02715 [Candidatus Bathyarchaeia archaeon]